MPYTNDITSVCLFARKISSRAAYCSAQIVEFFYADEAEMRNDTIFLVLRCGLRAEKVSRLMEKRVKGAKK